ncbi:MAG TPA: NADH-quinone oxidoreductase subunit C [Myxococcota bacterium]|nr:NADH-quinone oxidoreductase subunit C [Myxococcota bacterium]HQK50906.1 NADH-quinone oxidoreductase subunit C [Myxococcota bacterium]
MTGADLAARITAAIPDAVVAVEESPTDPVVQVRPEVLHAVAAFARQDLGMETLRLITAIDRPPETIDVVWHCLSMPQHRTLTLKTRLPRENPVVATVSDLWDAANWFEREQFDLVGVHFVGHPNLKRLLMPEDWVGHPLRKDYQRPEEYHGIPTARDRVVPVREVAPPMHGPKAAEQDGWMLLNMGPHHPATHGVLNFLLQTDGEIVRKATPDVGYLHRGIEKIAEMNTYAGTMPYTDRVDYLGGMATNQAWAMACERLLGVEVPRRGEFLRVIAVELNRIASHLIGTGSLAMDLGAFTPFVHWLREREYINDLMERICGARLTYTYMRIGGVARDIDRETLDRTLQWLDHFEPMLGEFDRLIGSNEIFVNRLANIAVMPAEAAMSFSLVGPNLRGSGVRWDLRRDEPYSVYPELEFDVPVGRGFRGTVGDAYDRFMVRMLEMQESARILRQAIARIPDGEFRAKVPRVLKPPAREAYGRVEAPRGEAGFYVVSNGTERPERVRIRTGCFTAMPAIESLSPGLMVADIIALIGSLDVIAPEVDR